MSNKKRKTEEVNDLKKQLYDKYFGSEATFEDFFGPLTYKINLEEISGLIKKYQAWAKQNNPNNEILQIEQVPEPFKMLYRIQFNLSGENYQRAVLISKLIKKPLSEVLDEVLKKRAVILNVEDLTPALVYVSTIYRGTTQVISGKYFEDKVQNFLEKRLSNFNLSIRNGKIIDEKKYDKDILCNNELLLSLEISFQVTGNSAMERKSHLNTGDRNVIFVFGGAGWLQRAAALSRIEDIGGSSPYIACFGCVNSELERLAQFIIDYAKQHCPSFKSQKKLDGF